MTRAIEPSPVETVEAFFAGLVVLMASDKKADAIDQTYRIVEEWIMGGHSENIYRLFEIAPKECEDALLPLSVFLSLLTATRPWRSSLDGKGRQHLLEAVAKRAVQDLSPEEARQTVTLLGEDLALEAWRRWFKESGNQEAWAKVTCIECELGRTCLQVPLCEGAEP